MERDNKFWIKIVFCMTFLFLFIFKFAFWVENEFLPPPPRILLQDNNTCQFCNYYEQILIIISGDILQTLRWNSFHKSQLYKNMVHSPWGKPKNAMFWEILLFSNFKICFLVLKPIPSPLQPRRLRVQWSVSIEEEWEAVTVGYITRGGSSTSHQLSYNMQVIKGYQSCHYTDTPLLDVDYKCHGTVI